MFTFIIVIFGTIGLSVVVDAILGETVGKLVYKQQMKFAEPTTKMLHSPEECEPNPWKELRDFDEALAKAREE